MKPFQQVRPTSRIVQWAVGIVLSGSAAVLLSGSALADVSPGTTTQNDTTDQTQVTNSTSTVSVDQSGSNTTGGVGVTVNNDNDLTPTSGQSADPNDQTLTGPGSNDQASLTPADNAEASPSDPTTPATDPASAATPTNDNQTPVAAPVDSQHYYKANLSAVTVVGAPVMLAAASAPYNPTPAKQPVKTNGLLVQLSDNLAATVVPQLFRLETLLGALPTAPIALITLLILVTSLTASIFVTALRRSGYSHAARSDVPFLTFATSLPLGYGRAAHWRVHSPVFVMSETQTAVLTMFPTHTRKEVI